MTVRIGVVTFPGSLDDRDARTRDRWNGEVLLINLGQFRHHPVKIAAPP